MADSPKTRPTDADVREFLRAAVPAKRREDGLRLAEIFGEVTGVEPVMWGPSIVGYGSYRLPPRRGQVEGAEWPKVGFSPRKSQLSIYGLKDLPEGAELLANLGDYSEGAGCVYVRNLDGIDEAVLRELIRIRWSRDAPGEPEH